MKEYAKIFTIRLNEKISESLAYPEAMVFMNAAWQQR